jgi:hypothetical protein
MSPQSRLVAGIVLIIVPTVAIGGASILSLLIADPALCPERPQAGPLESRPCPCRRVARALLDSSTLRGRGNPL